MSQPAGGEEVRLAAREVDPIQLVWRVGGISVALVALAVMAYALVPEAGRWISLLSLSGIASVGAVAALALWLQSRQREGAPKSARQDFLDAVLFAGFVALVGGLGARDPVAAVLGTLLILASLAGTLGWAPCRSPVSKPGDSS